MIGELQPVEVETLLRDGCIARMGCCDRGRAYVIPVSYTYDGTFIYGYTAEGKKLELMRRNRSLCFQVDRLTDPTDWRSVIAWGTFEELEGEHALDALERLSAHLRTAAAADHFRDARTFVNRSHRFGIAYRVRVVEKSGRFETVTGGQSG